MKLTDIKKKADKMKIKNSAKMEKTDLIRNIQQAEGNFACFATASNCCDQLDCCWRVDCIKI